MDEAQNRQDPQLHVFALSGEDPALLAEATALFCEALGPGSVTPESLERVARGPRSRAFGAARETTLLGAASAQLLGHDRSYYDRFGPLAAPAVADERVGNLDTLAVRSDHRVRGVGRALAERCLAWFVEMGCTQVVAVSWLSGGPNPSGPLFERLGFRPIVRAENVYLDASRLRGLYCPFCQGDCRCAGMLYALDLKGVRSGTSNTMSPPSDR